MNESLELCVKYWMVSMDTARKTVPEQLTREGLTEAIEQLNQEILRLNLLLPHCGE